MSETLKHMASNGGSKLAIPVVLISLGASMMGGYIKDRLSTVERDSANTVKIEALEAAMKLHMSNAVPADGYRREMQELRDKDYVPHAEWKIYNDGISARLDDIRDDIKEIKRAVLSNHPAATR